MAMFDNGKTHSRTSLQQKNRIPQSPANGTGLHQLCRRSVPDHVSELRGRLLQILLAKQFRRDISAGEYALGHGDRPWVHASHHLDKRLEVIRKSRHKIAGLNSELGLQPTHRIALGQKPLHAQFHIKKTGRLGCLIGPHVVNCNKPLFQMRTVS